MSHEQLSVYNARILLFAIPGVDLVSIKIMHSVYVFAFFTIKVSQKQDTVK